MTHLHTREATVHDVPAIARLEREIFGLDAWSEDIVREEVTGPHRRYFVVEQSGKLIGYGGVLVVGEDGDVQTIALTGEARGRGLGKKLFSDLLDDAVSRGARRVFLEVRSDNTVAMGIYHDAGFRAIGRRKNYYRQQGVDAITMMLDRQGPGEEARDSR